MLLMIMGLQWLAIVCRMVMCNVIYYSSAEPIIRDHVERVFLEAETFSQ